MVSSSKELLLIDLTDHHDNDHSILKIGGLFLTAFFLYTLTLGNTPIRFKIFSWVTGSGMAIAGLYETRKWDKLAYSLAVYNESRKDHITNTITSKIYQSQELLDWQPSSTTDWENNPEASTQDGDRTHLENFFLEYGFNLKQTEVIDGLASIQYRFKPAPRTPVTKVLGLQGELLTRGEIDGVIGKIKGAVTITATKAQGDRQFVTLKNHPFPECPNPKGCCFLLGYNDLTSKPIIVDLTSPNHPHALVGGTTGGGKTITIISWLISMMHWYSSEHLKFLILDPKGDYSPDGKASLADFVNCRYMLRPNILDIEDGLEALQWAIEEMKQRQINQKNPYQLVILIDEFADYMRPPEFKDESARTVSELAAKARSAGIHLIVCTQHPLAEIIPTHISGNLPLKVGLKMDKDEKARPILGELYPMTKLLGQGHGVTIIPGEGLQQFQSLYATRDELLNVMGQSVSQKVSPNFRNVSENLSETVETLDESTGFGDDPVIDVDSETVKNDVFDWRSPYASYPKIIELIDSGYSKNKIREYFGIKAGDNNNYKEFNQLYNAIMEQQNNANAN